MNKKSTKTVKKEAPEPKIVVADAQIYHFSGNGQDFLGQIEGGLPVKTSVVGGCVITTPVDGKLSDFKVREATREENLSIKQL